MNVLKKIACLTTVIVIVFIFTPTMSYALFLPFGGIASARRLGNPDQPSSSYNLSYAPVLLDLAKVLGRYQTANGYYIQNESFANQPGIDLRSLLINQSGLLQLLLSTPTEGNILTQTNNSPNLAVTPMSSVLQNYSANSQGSDIPQLAYPNLETKTSPRTSGLASPTHPKAATPTQIGSPEQINVPVASNELNGSPPPLISLDFSNLTAALTPESTPPSSEGALQTLMVKTTIPTTSISPKEHEGFMLWSLNSTSSKAPENTLRGTESNISISSGTFVACMPDVRFKSLSNSYINLKQGRLLISCGASNLAVETSFATVNLRSGSVVILDLKSDQSFNILALEPSYSGSVEVQLLSGKAVQLSQGDHLLIIDRNSSPNSIDEMSNSQLLDTGTTRLGHFSLKSLIDKDPLLNAKEACLTDTQKAVVNALRQKLSDVHHISSFTKTSEH